MRFHTAKKEMRQVGEDFERKGKILNAVVDDAEIKVTRPGDQSKQTIAEIEQAEIEKKVSGRPGRQEGCDAGPGSRGQVQAVVIDIERKDAKCAPLRIRQSRNVIQCGRKEQSHRIKRGNQPKPGHHDLPRGFRDSDPRNDCGR